MIRFVHLGTAALVLAACGAAPAPPAPKAPGSTAAPGDQLTQLVEHYWDESRRLNPQDLPEGPDVRYDGGEGMDISAQFLADSLALERRYLKALLAVPRASLGADAQLTYDIFKRERELAVESFTYPSELLPVNPFRSMPLKFAWTGSGMDRYALSSAKDYDDWQARADDFVRWTGQAIANMREGMRRGYTVPRVLVLRTLPVLAALGADTPQNVFYQTLRSIPDTIVDRARLYDGITAGVRDKVLPAYRALHAFLRDEYLPRARESVGLSGLPLGESWYAFLIKRETGSHLTAAELHALGLAETERLNASLKALLAEAGFGGSAQEFFEAMQRDPRATTGTPDDLVRFYEETKPVVAAAIPASFEQPLETDFALRLVEPFREATAPALSYQRALGRNSPALLYVNAAGLPARPVMPATALFLREALPGHHYQLATQAGRADLPRFRRFGGDAGFVEGWSQYAVSLGDEMGLYRDAGSKFAALGVRLQCAAGMVIDTGLNSLGWSRRQALDYLREKVPMDAAAAENAVDRDLALPGEALACAVGAHTLESLRTRAEQASGGRFDPRAFHAELLNGGAMPLDILDSQVNGWLAGPH